MGLQMMTGDGADHALLLVKHHVEDEVHADQAAGLVDVVAHGVALEDTGARARPQHHAVVVADGGVRAQAGDHGFGAAAEAGEVVVLDVAGADAQVGVEVRLEHLEAGASRRRAHRHALGGLKIDEAHATRVDLGADELRLLLGRVLAVPAEGKEHGDALRRQRRELVQQRRQELVRRARPRDVADHDHRRGRLGCKIVKRRRADGLRQGASDLRLLLRVGGRRGRRLLLAEVAAGAHHREQVGLGQLERQLAVAVRDAELQRGHVAPGLSRSAQPRP